LPQACSVWYSYANSPAVIPMNVFNEWQLEA
jgi:hypothetical protein